MGSLEDRLDALERRLRPRAALDPDERRRREQAYADCEALARIVRDSGSEFGNALARAQELHPDWTQQLEATRQIILASGPDGPRLWRILAEAVEDR